MTDRYPYYKGSRGYASKSAKPTLLPADYQHGYWWHRNRYLKTGDPDELAAMLARDLPDLPDRYTCCGGLVVADPAGHRGDCPKHGTPAPAPRAGKPWAAVAFYSQSARLVVALYLLVGVIAWLLGLAS